MKQAAHLLLSACLTLLLAYHSEAELIVVYSDQTVEDYDRHFCCPYCRSEPAVWVTLGGSFMLSEDIPATSMSQPAAFLVNDNETAIFEREFTTYRFLYGGAPISIAETSTNNPTALLAQYVQVDLAEPGDIGGLLTQGGFYGSLPDYYARTDSWMSEFAVSFSNDSQNFQWYRDEWNRIKVFPGNTDATSTVLTSFPDTLRARYMRLHPLEGHTVNGPETDINVRVQVVTCEPEVCYMPKINCLMSEWSDWSECTCSGACTRSRQREVIRIQACGGSRCGLTEETETGCTEPEPAWKTAIMIVGILLAIIFVAIIIGVVIWRTKHRNHVEVIVVKDTGGDKKPQPRMMAPAPGPRGTFGQGMAPGAPPMAGGFPGGRPFGPRPPMFRGPAPPRGSAPVRFSGTAGGAAPVD